MWHKWCAVSPMIKGKDNLPALDDTHDVWEECGILSIPYANSPS